MEDFGEFTDLIAAISKITNIEFDPLLEDLAICDQEIGKSLKHFSLKILA